MQAKIFTGCTLLVFMELVVLQWILLQALLRYYGVKIAEINKIIRELWLMTSKVKTSATSSSSVIRRQVPEPASHTIIEWSA